MSVLIMPQPERIVCDANGLPVGHRQAVDKVIDLFAEMVNEIPEGPMYLNRVDAEWIFDSCIAKYLHNVVRER